MVTTTWTPKPPFEFTQFCHKGVCLLLSQTPSWLMPMSCETCLVWGINMPLNQAMILAIKNGSVYPYQENKENTEEEIELTLKITVPKWVKKEVRWVRITTAICSKLSTANKSLYIYTYMFDFNKNCSKNGSSSTIESHKTIQDSLL